MGQALMHVLCDPSLRGDDAAKLEALVRQSASAGAPWVD